MLKLRFKKLHSTIVDSVNPACVIDFLFQQAVIGADDMRALQEFGNAPWRQCRELLTLLHASENPQAFVQLYAAIKEESHLQWLIDKFTDQSLIYLLQQLNVRDQTGECMFLLKENEHRNQCYLRVYRHLIPGNVRHVSVASSWLQMCLTKLFHGSSA